MLQEKFGVSSLEGLLRVTPKFRALEWQDAAKALELSERKDEHINDLMKNHEDGELVKVYRGLQSFLKLKFFSPLSSA